MTRVCIGIHVHAEPERLHATLASLRANTTQAVELLLLPDGPDDPTKSVLTKLRDLPQLVTAEALGSPACFNRLAAYSDADVLVLLESGALVGPGWLDYMLAALDADPHNGLAGPSTNRSWNEQCVFPHSRNTPAEVARTAEAAARRFGKTWRTLEPLHSLADFCYVVRREVVQAIGAADESYGLGPCWEMDYNIRAVRAGFQGVWACAAYVHRAPSTPQRQREETRRFEASKRRYQDKFCALRLRRERADYEPHCRGEKCEHFAPSALIQINLPLQIVTPNTVSVSGVAPLKTVEPVPVVSSPETAPLVSCIMPTRNRMAFLLQSIHYFQRQDYPVRELIIVDDGTENLTGMLPNDPSIRYLRLPPGQSIGAKRNQACELAHGSIIAHWDDDDWYAPGRLSAQVAPLLSGEADISGFNGTIFFDLTRWEFWSCTQNLHRRLFLGDVHGGTLVYRRHIWERFARYPDRSLAEDAVFLNQAIRRGARLRRIPNDGLLIYLRHTGNSWSFACGQYLDPRGWQRMAEPILPLEDRTFYAAHSPAAPIVLSDSPSQQLRAVQQPLVSCIMPTADRRTFVPQAIKYFLKQDYPNRELIVVDDGTDTVADLIPPDPRIRYIRLGEKHTLGAKRNLACKDARGEVIVHWDDDDWVAPWRLSYQIRSLLIEGADVCGLDKVFFYDPGLDRSWQYVFKGDRPWVAGGTFCYTKAFWSINPFTNVNIGEDTRFVWGNRSTKMTTLQDCTFYVAIIHPRNSNPKRTKDARWLSYPTTAIQEVMGTDWAFYAEALQNTGKKRT